MIMNKKNNLVFSVVIPTYNRAHLVKRAIKSVLLQTYPGFEIIIVDDCSCDNTEEVIQETIKEDKRVRYVKLDKNRGASAARNRGVEQSKGDYIAFLDSDDEALGMWLEKSKKKMLQLPQSWGVLYPRYYIKDELTDVMYLNAFSPMEGNIFKDLMRGSGLSIGVSGAVVKKLAFLEVGGFDEKLCGYHDYDLWYKMAREWTFHFVNAPLILFHDHQNLRLMGETEKREKAYSLFHQKWKVEIEKIAGKDAIEKRKSKRAAGTYLSLIRTEVVRKGRIVGIKLLLHSFFSQNFGLFYFIKYVLMVLVGPYHYLRIKRLYGVLYWKYKKF